MSTAGHRKLQMPALPGAADVLSSSLRSVSLTSFRVGAVVGAGVGAFVGASVVTTKLSALKVTTSTSLSSTTVKTPEMRSLGQRHSTSVCVTALAVQSLSTHWASVPSYTRHLGCLQAWSQTAPGSRPSAGHSKASSASPQLIIPTKSPPAPHCRSSVVGLRAGTKASSTTALYPTVTVKYSSSSCLGLSLRPAEAAASAAWTSTTSSLDSDGMLLKLLVGEWVTVQMAWSCSSAGMEAVAHKMWEAVNPACTSVSVWGVVTPSEVMEEACMTWMLSRRFSSSSTC
mmetsp:Transcript_9516/g.14602  ORF Transcript_9516/g.14602 Transcript_9516/m.14602 type:complete len:286 (-) Transcript_9516:89-946(-)